MRTSGVDNGLLRIIDSLNKMGMGKENLTDVAFLLVARFDSVQRLDNALAVSEYLSETNSQ